MSILRSLRRSVIAYLESELDNLVTDGAEDAKPTAGFQRVIQRAVIHVQSRPRRRNSCASTVGPCSGIDESSTWSMIVVGACPSRTAGCAIYTVNP
jgi:hypothetical protein